MTFFPARIALAIVASLSCALLTVASRAEEQNKSPKLDPKGVAFFERHIRPALVKHCYECHSAKSEELGGNLLVDSRDALLQGGDSGAAIVAGNPAKSLLIASLEYRDLEMPPDEQLPADVIRKFRTWVKMGAPDPRTKSTMPVLEEAETPNDLWSLQPVEAAAPPKPKQVEWAHNEIDRFILARLEQEQLQPASPAGPLTLLRRVHFDLTGLPPTLETIAAFEANPSDEAYAEIVDRLLASPQFGERWARHWFDVARYAESAGNSRDVLMPHAWRYRDYVIDALNNDLPYDRFVKEQIAGDLLAADLGENADAAEAQRLHVATGLLAVGSKSLNGGNITLDLVDDQIDVVGKAMMGLTVSCARCHDHKFDPIPTADYYSLAGIFRSTETLYGGGIKRPGNDTEKAKVYLVLGGDSETPAKELKAKRASAQALNTEVAKLSRQVAALTKRLPKDWRKRRAQLANPKPKAPAANATTDNKQAADVPPKDDAKSKKKPKAQGNADTKLLRDIRRFETLSKQLKEKQKTLTQLRAELPKSEFAIGVREGKRIADAPIQIRGDKSKAGDVVKRGFLSCVSIEGEAALPGKDESGRRELAQWLTHPSHPLTARVAVNRIWAHLMGRGIVATVDNFGVNGAPPSHPELLDYLASRFRSELKWSQKSLIREIVLSATYRQSTEWNEAAYEKDPDNMLRWRSSRRRLEAEPIRDAILSASGQLELARPQASLVTKIGEGEVGRNINTKPLVEPFPHRSVYLPIIRTLLPDMLRRFDLPEPSNPQGQRDASNVPSQSLFFMNSEFVLAQSTRFAKRVLELTSDDEGRIDAAFRLALSRPPTKKEKEGAAKLLTELANALKDKPNESIEQQSWAILCQSILASAEFRYVD